MNKQIQLIFATQNQNKVREISDLMPEHIAVRSLSDIGCFEDIPETGSTLEENALLKVRYVRNKYGYNCFADDTGLEVEALGGAPGVYSARYAGEEKNDNANIDKLLQELKEKKTRTASFKTVIALFIGGKEYCFTGTCPGEISLERRGENGFGYDPVFRPDGFFETFAQISLKEKSLISHRGKATAQLIDFLNKGVF